MAQEARSIRPSHWRAAAGLAGLAALCVGCAPERSTLPTEEPVVLTHFGEVDFNQLGEPKDTAAVVISPMGELGFRGQIALPDLCRRVEMRAVQHADTLSITIRAQAIREGQAYSVPDNCQTLSGGVPYRISVEPARHRRALVRITHALAARDGTVYSTREFTLGQVSL